MQGADVQVVVVGSGASGAAAALSAAAQGASVVVLEGADQLGGTTTYSGGVSWLPRSRAAVEAGVDDDAEAVQTYLDNLSLGDVDRGLIRTFVADAPTAAAWLEAHSDLRWRLLDYPDYHPERPGGLATGRALEPAPTAVPAGLLQRLRLAPTLTAPIAYGEIGDPAVDAREVARRQRDGVLAAGRGLVGVLLAAVERAGGDVRTGARVVGLATDGGGAVVGARLADGEVVAGPVVLATGGFERNTELVRTYLRMPQVVAAGAPTARGDAIGMALDAGAQLGNMGEAWWCPTAVLDDVPYEGEPVHRLLLTERIRPRSIIVDATGRRFVDESRNYNDLGRAMHDFDASTFSFPRATSWLVVDGGYRRRYHLGPLRRDAPDPPWLHRGETVAGLADAIGVPAAALEATVDRFNDLARAGDDADLGRGRSAYERALGDPRAPHPTLGPLDEPPYFAVRVRAGAIGTKGGPRTDEDGRVRARRGGVVEGLFAVGNAAANPFGLLYPGAGGTIGPMLVFGVRAGRAAAAAARRAPVS